MYFETALEQQANIDAFLSTSVLVFSFAPPPFHCGPCSIIFVRFLLIYHIFSSTCMSCLLHIIYTGASSFSISYSLIRGTQLFVCSILFFLLDYLYNMYIMYFTHHLLRWRFFILDLLFSNSWDLIICLLDLIFLA